MKTAQIGILSAVTASLCCVGPLLLAALGLGSLGFGAAIGRYHGWFLIGASVLLAIAWRSYLTKARRCRTARCEMAHGKATRVVLIAASVIVAFFVGLNIYAYAKPLCCL